MSSFNKTKKSAAPAPKPVPVNIKRTVAAKPNTINAAGGQAFKLTPHYELAFLLLTSFLENTFYKTKPQTIQQVREAIVKVNDPLFTAKAAIYARNVYGMRSISHLVAAEIAKGVKGVQFTKNFFNKVVRRVDDASEILAAYLGLHGKPIPNSLKKGLALAMSKFSAYQLAKYKGENNDVTLVDLFNIVHPKPNAENAKAYKDLIEGNLASEGTWEADLSAAGQGPGDKAEKKAAVWADLVGSGKLGYFALLRNLRNILEQADTATQKKAADMLVNKKLIEQSLVLPFRFMTAQAELGKLEQNQGTRRMQQAVSDAIEVALSNVPEFDGETLVVLDDSGSMFGRSYCWNAEDTKSPAAIGSLFAAVLAKKNNADLMLFNSDARYLTYRHTDPVASITEDIRKMFKSGVTNFHAIFDKANRKYDRIIILSDMQGWIGSHCPLIPYKNYCTRHNANPKIYSFDLANIGTVQFPQNDVYCLAGFSEKTLDLMKVLETDPSALLKEINAIDI